MISIFLSNSFLFNLLDNIGDESGRILRFFDCDTKPYGSPPRKLSSDGRYLYAGNKPSPICFCLFPLSGLHSLSLSSLSHTHTHSLSLLNFTLVCGNRTLLLRCFTNRHRQSFELYHHYSTSSMSR